MGQLQNLLTKISEAASFLGPEIQAIPDETFAQFLENPALSAWKTALKKIRRMKPHVLSEREERLLALGSSALDGYDDTFSQLTDVDMKFGVLTDEKGTERPLTQSSYSLISGEAGSCVAQAGVPSILRGISRSPVYARFVTRLLGEGRCLPRTRQKLSLRARSLAVPRRCPRGGL